MAGATLALALARHAPSLSVRVIEHFPLASESSDSHYQPSYDARSTALSWGSRKIYERLGLWPELSRHATPIRNIHVSDKGHFGASRLSAAEHQKPALGYVVDNRWLGQTLVRALAHCPSVQWQAPAKVEQVEPTERGVRVSVTIDGVPDSVDTQCLVVADGGRSGLREALGFRAHHADYQQHALIANVTTARAHDFVAYERFTDAGPMALLPRGNPNHASGESTLVWTLSDAQLSEVLAASDADKCARLQARFGWRLGRIEHVGECSHYPLTLTTVAEPVRQGVVLVGNAAHTLHPVAGQGFNLALRGLMVLTDTFARAVREGQPLGTLGILQQFQAEHRQDWRQTVRFSNSLIQLFGHESRWVAAVRDAGLVGLDLLPGAKRWFSEQAMGLGRRQTRMPGMSAGEPKGDAGQ